MNCGNFLKSTPPRWGVPNQILRVYVQMCVCVCDAMATVVLVKNTKQREEEKFGRGKVDIFSEGYNGR